MPSDLDNTLELPDFVKGIIPKDLFVMSYDGLTADPVPSMAPENPRTARHFRFDSGLNDCMGNSNNGVTSSPEAD